MGSKYEFLESIKFIHEHDIDPLSFQIYLVGREDPGLEEMEMGEPGVEYRMASRFIKNLDILTNIDEARPILISMKSCGGDVHEGMCIYDAIMAAPNPVTIVSYTHARSMTSIILQAANKRILMPSSYFMFHDGDSSFAGTTKQFHTYAEFSKRTFDNNMCDIYANRMKHTPGSKVAGWKEERILKWLRDEMDKKEDVYLAAQEAVEWGFADEIFSDWSTIYDYTEQELSIK